MSETWDHAVERAMNDAPESARQAWRRLREAEAAALERGARLIAELESKPPEKSLEVEAPPKGQPITEALPEELADLAESMASVLVKRGAANFLSLGAVHPVLGVVEIRVQRCDGKTPAVLLAEMAAERDELRLLHKAAADAVAELAARVEGLEAERDHYRVAYTKLLTQRDREYAEAVALRESVAATERRAAEATAQVEALTASLDRAIWEEKGAPMQGEPTTPGASPFDGHPFVSMPERPTVCATCGYSEAQLEQAAPIHAPEVRR